MKKRDILTWTVSTGIIAVLAASVLYLEHRGRQARVYAGPGRSLSETGLPVTVTETSTELYKLYKNKKVHGRILLHIGRYLHAVDIATDSIIPNDSGHSVSVADMLPLFEARISYQNVFWVAAQANIVREIYYLEPPGLFKKRMANLDERDIDVISKNSQAVVIHDWGSKRTISDQMPRVKEPVLLNIDASIFEELQPDELLRILRSSSVTADMVTLTLSIDNPEISDSNRSDLRIFSKMLSGGESN